MSKKIAIIACIGENNELGLNGDLVFQGLSEDLKNFNKVTKGHIVIMGRNTWESLPEKYRPLPNRTNIVVTSKIDIEGVVCATSFDNAIACCEDAHDDCASHHLHYQLNEEPKIFIIGGARMYKDAMDSGLVNEMYITHVHESAEADTFFPINMNKISTKLVSKSFTHICNNTNYTISKYDIINVENDIISTDETNPELKITLGQLMLLIMFTIATPAFYLTEGGIYVGYMLTFATLYCLTHLIYLNHKR
jgi:dihydrofolate reductase